jgi:hypothetical protein
MSEYFLECVATYSAALLFLYLWGTDPVAAYMLMEAFL